MEDKDLASIEKQNLFSAINQVISQPDFCKNPGKDFTRNRKMGAPILMQYMLSMSALSLDKDLYQYFKENYPSMVPPTKSAFVQQRAKLSDNAFPNLLHAYNSMGNDSKTYRGFYLFSFDGTALNTARNPESETYFEKGGYNQFLITALFDLCNYTYKDIEIKARPKQYEVRSAINLLSKTDLPPNSIVICDRLYATLNLIEHLNRKGVKYLIRCKESHTLTEINSLPDCECDVVCHRQIRTTQTKEDREAFKSGEAYYIQPYSNHNSELSRWDFESPYNMTFRIVKVWIGNKWEVLITNLSKESFSADSLKELYALRWGIETSFRDLKYSIGLTNLHSRNESYTVQEIYARVIMFNYCQRIARQVVVENQVDNIHLYQVNFTQAIHIARNYFRKAGDFCSAVCEDIKRYILPVRKGIKDIRKAVRQKAFIPFLYRVA